MGCGASHVDPLPILPAVTLAGSTDTGTGARSIMKKADAKPTLPPIITSTLQRTMTAQALKHYRRRSSDHTAIRAADGTASGEWRDEMHVGTTSGCHDACIMPCNVHDSLHRNVDGSICVACGVTLGYVLSMSWFICHVMIVIILYVMSPLHSHVH